MINSEKEIWSTPDLNIYKAEKYIWSTTDHCTCTGVNIVALSFIKNIKNQNN